MLSDEKISMYTNSRNLQTSKYHLLNKFHKELLSMKRVILFVSKNNRD